MAVVADTGRFIAEINLAFALDLTGNEDILASFESVQDLKDWLGLLIDESMHSLLDDVLSKLIRPAKPSSKHSTKVVIPPPTPARRPESVCGCFGTEHEVFSNCLRCGRILCLQEAAAFCPFCLAWLAEAPGRGEAAKKAAAHKDKLVGFDREGARRTQVFDDHTDWFSEADNRWRSREDREEAARKAQEAEEEIKAKKRQFTIRLNFDSSVPAVELVDNASDVQALQAKHKAELHEHVSKERRDLEAASLQANQLNEESVDVLKFIQADIANFANLRGSLSAAKSGKYQGRVVTDSVATMLSSAQTYAPKAYRPTLKSLSAVPVVSLPQPAASLVAYGFRRALRIPDLSPGSQLWIHASSRTPSPEEISDALAFYSNLYAEAGLPVPGFPAAFPTGSLVGVVEVASAEPVTSIHQARDAALRGEFPTLVAEVDITTTTTTTTTTTSSTGPSIVLLTKPRHLIFPHKYPGQPKLWTLPRELEPLWDSLVPSIWPLPDPWVPDFQSCGLTPSSAVSLRSGAAVEVVDPAGVVVIKNAVDISDQQGLLGLIARLATEEAPFFRARIPSDDRRRAFDSSTLFRGELEIGNFFRTCLGRFWETRKFSGHRRVHVDNLTVPAVPAGLVDFVLASAIACSHKLRFSLPAAVCDFVVADFLENPMTEYLDEFTAHPVVRLVLGRGCEFSYRSNLGERRVALSPGDILVTGNLQDPSWRVTKISQESDGHWHGSLVLALGLAD